MALLGAIQGRGFAVVVNSQGETKDRDANAGARCTELGGLAHGGLVGASRRARGIGSEGECGGGGGGSSGRGGAGWREGGLTVDTVRILRLVLWPIWSQRRQL